MTATASLPNFLSRHRIVVIAGAVLMFHALAIWALQSGLLMRAVELVVPVAVLAQIIEPPKPVPPVPLPPPPVIPKQPPPPPAKQAVVKPKPPVPQTQAPPQILAVETPAPAPSAPAPVQIAPAAPILPPSVPVAAVASPAPVPAPPSATGKVVLPMSEGDYLSNPKPPFPAMSKRMGEQGSVKVRIYVGADGLPKKAELQKSSGFERLDKAALDAVMQWRYIPGKRGGVPEDIWMSTTVSFILE